MRSTTLSVYPLARIRSRSHDQRRAIIESEQPSCSKRGDELDAKEWIARSLLVHQLCRAGCAIRLAVKRVRDQLRHVLLRERRKR